MTNCPRCGASNPSENKFCGQCGTLLAAPAPRPAADQLPAWLQESAPESSAEAPATAGQPEALPSWLNELGLEDEQPRTVETVPAPTWLAQLQQPAAQSATPTDTADELPAWLRDDLTSAPPVAATAPTSDIPEWLREFEAEQQAAGTPAPPTDVPPWLESPAVPPASAASAPPTSRTNSADELPDWLRTDTAASAAAPTAPATPSARPAGEELPDWLRDADTPPAPGEEQLPHLRATAIQPPSEQSSERLPAWLMSDQVHASTSAPRAEPEQAATTEIDMPVPDWGAEFGAPGTDIVARVDELPAWLHETAQPAAGSSTALQPAAQGDLDPPSWLQEDAPPATTATTQPLAPVSEEIPSWLQAEAPTVAPTTSAASAEDQELPGWLQEDTSVPGQAMPSTAEELPSWLQTTQEPAPPPTDGGLPPWLALPDQPVAEPETTQSDTTFEPGGLPPWLSESGTLDAQPHIAGSYERPDDVGLPAWLAEADAATEPSTINSYERPDDVGLPAWLADTESDQASHTARSYETPAQEAPAWLETAGADDDHTARVYDAPSNQANGQDSAATVQLPGWLAEVGPATTGTASTTQAEGDLPSWLSGLDAESPAAPQQNAAPTLPSWLDDPKSAASGPTAQPPSGQSEFLGGLDLPAWLREEPAQPAPVTTPVAEPAPSWLDRVASDSDEPAPMPPVVGEAPTRPTIARSPERIAAMQMLEELAASPAAEPVTTPASRRRAWLLPTIVALVALIFIAALLYILLNNRLGLSFGAAPVALPAVASASQMIANVPAQRSAMLVYEWDAQRIGDLGALEEVVVGQLAARTDVPLIFMSTDPQGALLATRRATQIDQLDDGFHEFGLGYVDLGFKAGGPIALRRLASNTGFGNLFAQDAYGRDLRNEAVALQSMCGANTADGCSWDNVGLLVVMADELDDVRGWFEQVRSEHPNLPTLVLTPAEIAPQIQPYTNLPQVSALAGLPAAEALARTRGVVDERLGRQVDATAVGSALFAALALIGAIPAYISGWRARRRTKDAA